MRRCRESGWDYPELADTAHAARFELASDFQRHIPADGANHSIQRLVGIDKRPVDVAETDGELSSHNFAAGIGRVVLSGRDPLEKSLLGRDQPYPGKRYAVSFRHLARLHSLGRLPVYGLENARSAGGK